MKSLKRCSVVIAALFTLALFTSSAMASGSYVAEQEGKPLAIGSLVEFKSSQPVSLYTKVGTVTCGETVLSAKAVVNKPRNGTENALFQMGEGGISAMSSCTRDGSPVQIDNVAQANFKSTGGGTAVSTLKLNVALSASYVCKLSTDLNWSYKSGTSSIAFSETPGIYNQYCGTWHLLGGQFTALSKGKPVIFN